MLPARLRLRRRRDERAAEAVAMLFVIPVLVVLVFALIDVGMMFRSRMLVENIARDAVRSAAADGGLFNERTSTTNTSWETWAESRLVKNNGVCKVGYCQHGKEPTVDCWYIDATGGRYDGNVVHKAGDLVTCHITYPYAAINSGLLNSPIGLGMGALIQEFEVQASARAETGDTSLFIDR